MDYFLAILFIIFMIAGVLLQILNLPGNWAAILFLVIWKFIGPASTTHELTLLFFAAIIALAAAGELTGEVRSADILEDIFSTFCIGK